MLLSYKTCIPTVAIQLQPSGLCKERPSAISFWSAFLPSSCIALKTRCFVKMFPGKHTVQGLQGQYFPSHVPWIHWRRRGSQIKCACLGWFSWLCIVFPCWDKRPDLLQFTEAKQRGHMGTHCTLSPQHYCLWVTADFTLLPSSPPLGDTLADLKTA